MAANASTSNRASSSPGLTIGKPSIAVSVREGIICETAFQRAVIELAYTPIASRTTPARRAAFAGVAIIVSVATAVSPSCSIAAA